MGSGSTLLGYNGTCPESPDGQRVLYCVKPKLGAKTGEIWVANTDLSGHRKVYDVAIADGRSHNGADSSWVDNRLVAFRHIEPGKPWAFKVVDVDAAADVEADSEADPLVHGPIYGKLGHEAMQGKLPFVVQHHDQVAANAATHPEIDEPGLYLLDSARGVIEKVMVRSHLLAHEQATGVDLGVPDESKSLDFTHAMLNPSATRAMVKFTKKRIVSCDLQGVDIKVCQPKPLHQLWYDDETYIAVQKKGIWRLTQDGKPLEQLGGKGNHIDISPDQQRTVTDPGYGVYGHGVTPFEIVLYPRGSSEGQVIIAHPFGMGNRTHANPVFSRDGRYVYCMLGTEDGDVRLMRVPVADADAGVDADTEEGR